MISNQTVGEVVVGVDGSPQSIAAARWAGEEAQIRGIRLHLATAVPRWANDMPDWGRHAEVGGWVREEADRGLAEARAAIKEDHPGVVVVCARRSGEPAPVLIELARTAELIVVGTHGTGGFIDMLLGSVAVAVASRSACPAVVHRALSEPGPRRKVVVGVDFSSHDQPIQADEAAVLLAVSEAGARHADLQLLTAHSEGWTFGKRGPHRDSSPEVIALRQQMSALTDHWSSRYNTLRVTGTVVAAHPVDALVEASGHADLLVVGRGHSGARLPVGSVARGALHHAKSPVAIVPGV